MGKGLVGPSNLVAQTHFAIAENVGDVLAKEEVWLVVGELCGLGLGIGILVKEHCCPTFIFFTETKEIITRLSSNRDMLCYLVSCTTESFATNS
jgi:hypothetical protein